MVDFRQDNDSASREDTEALEIIDDFEDDDHELQEQRPLPTFDEFTKAGIFNNLANTLGFDLVVSVPKMFNWVGTDVAPLVAGRIYEEVLTTLESSGFYSYENLFALTSNRQAGVSFKDDEFGFELFFDEEGDLVIRRAGSSLERFYTWYERFMPSAQNLVNKVLNAVAQTLQLTYVSSKSLSGHNRSEIRLNPVAASYHFSFLAYDFKRPPSQDIEKNVSILKELLRVVPGEDGHLQETTQLDAQNRLGRIDISLTRFVEDVPGFWAREVYNVQGPSNRKYTMLLAHFYYKGESFEIPTGGRQKFDATGFLSSYEIPLVIFLKGRAIENFLSQLTRGYVFETSTGSLP